METKIITIDTGRDAGKTFRIREFPALRGEKWAARALVALLGTNAEIPDNLAEAAKMSNMAAIAQAGFKCLSGLNWETLEPLYDELLGQVDIVPDPAKPTAVIPLSSGNVDAHVKNPATLFRLRAEVFGLCVNFFVDGVVSESLASKLFNQPDLSTTPTVPASSA